MIKITIANAVGSEWPLTVAWWVGSPYPDELDRASAMMIMVVDGPEMDLVRRSIKWFAGLHNPKVTVGEVDTLIKQLQSAADELRTKIEQRNERNEPNERGKPKL